MSQRQSAAGRSGSRQRAAAAAPGGCRAGFLPRAVASVGHAPAGRPLSGGGAGAWERGGAPRPAAGLRPPPVIAVLMRPLMSPAWGQLSGGARSAAAAAAGACRSVRYGLFACGPREPAAWERTERAGGRSARLPAGRQYPTD